MVHEQMSRFFTGFRRDAHPMAVMCGVVGALSAFYHDSTDASSTVGAMSTVPVRRGSLVPSGKCRGQRA